MKIILLTELVDCCRNLLRIQKRLETLHRKHCELTFHNSSTKQRASSDQRITDTCWERDQAKDRLHCILVNLNITDPHPIESYETRTIKQSAGYGHSIDFKHTPPIPNCIQEQISKQS